MQLAAQVKIDEVIAHIEKYNEEMGQFLDDIVIVEFHQALASMVDTFPPSAKARAGMESITIKITNRMAREKTLKNMELLAGKAFGPYYKSFVNLRVVNGPLRRLSLKRWYMRLKRTVLFSTRRM